MSELARVPGPRPRFAPGDRVRIDDRDPPVHHRTPRYVRGQVGVIERVAGAYREPERAAYGDDRAPRRVLYRVHLELRGLWPADPAGAGDTLEIEIYEHWLEPAP